MLYLLYIYKDKLLHLIGDLKGQWYSCTNKRDGIVSTLWQILNKSKHIETQNYEKMVVIEYDYDCWNQILQFWYLILENIKIEPANK
jgi:hypothetical protein